MTLDRRVPLAPEHLAALRPLLGCVNANPVGPHPPGALRLGAVAYGRPEADGRVWARLGLERSGSFGHNHEPGPDGRPVPVARPFPARDFPAWLADLL